MKEKQFNIPDDELLRKYLSGELSEEESESLRKQLESDPSLREHVRKMEKIWELSSGIREIDTVDLEGDWHRIGEKSGQSGHRAEPASPASGGVSRIVSLNLLNRAVRIAAIVIIAAFSGYAVYHFTAGPASGFNWITVQSTHAIEEIKLPDGSMVSLNSWSTLEYPEKFRKKERRVKLEGEAFFEVQADEKMPFTIDVADFASARVLGTSFNLRQDPDEKKVTLNVRTGKVAFFAKKKKEEPVIVEKDEQAVYENGVVQQSARFDLNFLSWKTKVLEFDSTPLPEVLEQLGRHYHTEFLLADRGMDTLSITGIYRNEDLADVLDEIGMVLDIDFRTEDGLVKAQGY